MSSTPFSQALRERTQESHSSSESSGFMVELCRGTATKEDFAALVSQHYFIYQAIESVAAQLVDDEVAGEFIDQRLNRLPKLEADLRYLLGDNWREQITPLPSTARYVDRILQSASWGGLFVAHHYTRYLGDLSGGLIIGKLVRKEYGLDEGGVSFYDFDEIENPKAFKESYRAALDSADWSDEEQERIIDEVLLAYHFNNEVFADLDTTQPHGLVLSHA